MVYIEGYSLLSALGDSAYSCIKAIRDRDYKTDCIEYYKIKDIEPLDYYDIIQKSILDAILDAKLSQEEIKNSALLVGTSSAKLPLNEYYAKKDKELLKDLYMEEITQKVSQKIGIESIQTIISTACTSSANALLLAKELIDSGFVKRVIVVGVELYNEFTIKGFESFMLLSQRKIKPFDKNRDGIVLGEAISTVILSQKKSDFELVGGAIKVDTTSITSPTKENLSIVMKEALEDSNISYKDISVIKSHSTATIQNDKAEAQAIKIAFGSNPPPIVALKPYIGHTMGACGTNELVLLVEALKSGFIPKSLNFRDIDNECGIIPSLEDLKAKRGYYLLNYFGFGGNNCSLVLKYKA